MRQIETSHLHPLLQFLYPSAISNAIAEIRCIRFLPDDDAALAVTSRHKLRQVVSSLPSLPSANLPMTWHCIAFSVFLYQSAPWAFQQSSKVLLGNCLGASCVCDKMTMPEMYIQMAMSEAWNLQFRDRSVLSAKSSCDVLHICKVVQLISYNVVWPSQILQLTWKSLHWLGWEPD